MKGCDALSGLPESEAGSILANLRARSATRRLQLSRSEAAIGTANRSTSFRSFHNKSALIGVEDAADLRFANWLLKTMGEHFTLHAREGFSD
jgi:hypothetical protein